MGKKKRRNRGGHIAQVHLPEEVLLQLPEIPWILRGGKQGLHAVHTSRLQGFRRQVELQLRKVKAVSS